jgi:hypothetical protein
MINYLELKAFMAESTAEQLNAITKEIISKYFDKSKWVFQKDFPKKKNKKS